MIKPALLSDSVGNYLKAIWVLAEEESISTKELAEHLRVTAPSVTGMLGKLAKLGLVTYERYYGAKLTTEGTFRSVARAAPSPAYRDVFDRPISTTAGMRSTKKPS